MSSDQLRRTLAKFGPSLGRCWPMLATLWWTCAPSGRDCNGGHVRDESRRCSPMTGWCRPKLGWLRPNTCGEESTKLGEASANSELRGTSCSTYSGATLGRRWPKLVKLAQDLATSPAFMWPKSPPQNWPRRQLRPRIGQVRPRVVEIASRLVEFGRLAPDLVFIRSCPKSL